MTHKFKVEAPDGAWVLGFLAPYCFRCKSLSKRNQRMLFSGHCDTGLLWFCADCGGEQYIEPGSQMCLFVPHEEWERRQGLTVDQRQEMWRRIRAQLWPNE